MYKIKIFYGSPEHIETQFTEFFKSALIRIDKIVYGESSNPGDRSGTLVVGFTDEEYDEHEILGAINEKIHIGIANLVDEYLKEWRPGMLDNPKEVYDKINQHILRVVNDRHDASYNLSMVYQELLERIGTLEIVVRELKKKLYENKKTDVAI